MSLSEYLKKKIHFFLPLRVRSRWIQIQDPNAAEECTDKVFCSSSAVVAAEIRMLPFSS